MACMSPILKIFGANGETYEYAKGYVQYIAWGAPFIIWSAAASFVVRSEGASKEAMIGSMVGTIANIVLDPLFITGLHMGLPVQPLRPPLEISLQVCILYGIS